MKKAIQLIFIYFSLFSFSNNCLGFVVDVKPEFRDKKEIKAELSENERSDVKLLKKSQEREGKLKKRFLKFKKKWQKRKYNKKKLKKRRRFFGGVSDDIRFKLGLILIVASLLIGILARVPIFGGIFGILAGLAGLVGLILIFMAMLDYY